MRVTRTERARFLKVECVRRLHAQGTRAKATNSRTLCLSSPTTSLIGASITRLHAPRLTRTGARSVPDVECETIYPFALQFSNVRSLSDALRPVHIPDEALDLPPNVDFSMAAGDFLQVYADQSGQWDAVATCFFIDTAKDIASYIELIWRLLPPGGIWINLGTAPRSSGGLRGWLTALSAQDHFCTTMRRCRTSFRWN